jgi:hypothetical protein
LSIQPEEVRNLEIRGCASTVVDELLPRRVLAVTCVKRKSANRTGSVMLISKNAVFAYTAKALTYLGAWYVKSVKMRCTSNTDQLRYRDTGNRGLLASVLRGVAFRFTV